MLVDTRTSRASYMDTLLALAGGEPVSGATMICLPAPLTPRKVLEVSDAIDLYSANEAWPVVAGTAAAMAGIIDGSGDEWQAVVAELSCVRDEGLPLMESAACRQAIHRLGSAADYSAGMMLAGLLPAAVNRVIHDASGRDATG